MEWINNSLTTEGIKCVCIGSVLLDVPEYTVRLLLLDLGRRWGATKGEGIFKSILVGFGLHSCQKCLNASASHIFFIHIKCKCNNIDTESNGSNEDAATLDRPEIQREETICLDIPATHLTMLFDNA